MSIPATMRALQQTSLNGPRDLRLITGAPVPVAGPGEVLIRVAAAGVNFGDVAQAHGTFLGGPQPPYLAGFEAAGEIVATGEGVTGAGTRSPRHRRRPRVRRLRRVHGAARGLGRCRCRRAGRNSRRSA